MTAAGILRASFLILVAATLVLAQYHRGSIRGTVLDPTGAVIPGAVVVVVNLATGIDFSTETTGVGSYYVARLAAGTYRVEVEVPGFKKLVHDVRVRVSEITALDLTLEVGATTEVITVKARAPQLKTETSELATNINPRTFLDLPLNASVGRGPADFLLLAPGVRGTGAFSYNINGGQTLSSQILIEGLDVSGVLGTPGDTRPITMPPEALQEFTLVTSNASVEFGNTGGGITSFTVRSGTNELHGNAYEFLRNDKLDARGFFPAARTINRQNEYGVSVGGPIYLGKSYDGRDRSFFFFNLNRFVTRGAPQTALISVPTPAFKTGDFSELVDARGNPVQIYDPATTRLNANFDPALPAVVPGNSRFLRDPFPSNMIPQERFSPISERIVGFYADPTGPGILSNYLERRVRTTNKDNFTTKFDHRITSAHNVSVSVNREHNPTTFCSNPCFGVNDIGATSSGTRQFSQSFARVAYDWIVTPTALVHVTAGLNRQLVDTDFNHTGQNWAQRLGLQNIDGNGPFPTVNLLPFQMLGNGGAGTDEEFQGTNLHFTVGLSVVRGSHNLKFGAEHIRRQTDHDLPTNTGRFSFSRNETAFPGTLSGTLLRAGRPAPERAVTGNSLASLLLGEVDRADHHVQEFTGGSKFGYWAGYFQDDIKLTRNFTLNFGIRWDLYLPMVGTNNNYSIMDASVPNPAAGGRPGALIFAGFGPGRENRRPLTPPISWNNYAPRLGFAWPVTPNWVIRAGYGIGYFGPSSAGTGSIREYNVGFAADPGFQSTDQGITPAFVWDNGFPAFRRSPAIDPGFQVGGNISLWDSNASEPSYTQSWHFTVQRQLAPGWLLDTAYVASKGTRLNSGAINVNQVDPAFLPLGDLLRLPIENPAVATAGFAAPYPGFEGSLAQALRPFPQYLFVGTGANPVLIPFLGGAQIGNSTYHSLQLKLERQFSKGLFLLGSYTWSKSITDAGSSMGGFFGTSARDHYNRRLEKALSPANLPHRLAVAFNHELPVGPGKSLAGNVTGAGAKILEGWQINGVLDYSTGNPIAVTVNNALPLFNDLNLPNVVSGVPQTLSTKNVDLGPFSEDRYLNPKAFEVPAPGTFGNAPRITGLRDFAGLNESFGLMKRTYIGETINVEARFKWFNAFNRHRFGGIQTNRSNPNFGQITSAGGNRQGQFALKINF